MFLNRRVYVLRSDREKIHITGIRSTLHPDKIKYIIEEAAYWRKANAIHHWFVKNVQGGEDDCKEYDVSREQLQELLDTVNTVLKASELVDGEITNGYSFVGGKKTPIVEKGKIIKNFTVAQKLLPPQAGLFFGGTNYDEYYIQDLQDTKEFLEKIFSMNKKEDYSTYYYASSW